MTKHVDREIYLFYGIVQGVCALAAVVMIVAGEYAGLGIVVPVMIGFALFGWPVSAIVMSDGSVRFDTPLRRCRIAPGDVRRVKYVRSGVGHRATLKLHRRAVPILGYRPDVGYRVSSFTDSKDLSAAVARVADASPGCVWDDGARRLLCPNG